MPRNMVIGNLKYLIRPASGHTSHRHLKLVLLPTTCGFSSGHDSASTERGTAVTEGRRHCSTDRKERGNVARVTLWVTTWRVSYVCLARLRTRFESAAAHGQWDCLTLLPHRVRSGRLWWGKCWMMKDNCLYHHGCLDRCSPRMVKLHLNLKAKSWK